jgi:hypothetical protein
MIDEEYPLLKRRPTINPYRHTAFLIVNRLAWDLRFESWPRRRMRSWQDKYSGQKAVILCNGPSLLKSDLSLLDGIFTFGFFIRHSAQPMLKFSFDIFIEII